MSTNTTNYDLVKPDTTDFYDIEVMNDNLDKIDTAIKQAKDAADNVDLSQIESDIQGIDQKVTQHLAQNEYQTPTISGAQIRLQKTSDSNRIFFKLDAELNGSITISTDNGATSKNLVDVDGVHVTSLEKGFHEIVASANFFILRNRGLSKAQLQALITIVNEAEANESVLRTNYVNVVNGADESISLPTNATWNDILLQIPNIKLNSKKCDSGIIQSSSTQAAFQFNNSTTSYNYPKVTVENLPFKPSFIFIKSLVANGFTIAFFDSVNNMMITRVAINGNGQFTGNHFVFKSNALDGIITDDGFVQPVQSANSSYFWIAFE